MDSPITSNGYDAKRWSYDAKRWRDRAMSAGKGLKLALGALLVAISPD